MDELLICWMRENIVTVSLVLGVLKIIAVETPWAGDDKIVEIITGLVGRGKR